MAIDDNFDPSGFTLSITPGVGVSPTAPRAEDNIDPADYTKPILQTPFKRVPNREDPKGTAWGLDRQAAGKIADAVVPPLERIGDAAATAWKDTPDFWTPRAQQALDKPLEGANPYVRAAFEPTVRAVTRGVIEPAGNLVSGAMALPGALFRGAQQATVEAGKALPEIPYVGGVFGPNGIDTPRLARDIAAIPESRAGLGGAGGGFMHPRFEVPKYQGAATMEGANAVARRHYEIANTDRTVLKPGTVDSALDSVKSSTPREVARDLTTGETEITRQIARLEQFRGKPMSVQQWQGVNEGLGEAVSNFYISEPAVSRRLGEIQRTLRDRIQNAGEGDLLAGTGRGLDAIKQGNEAYSQARKMEDVERMMRQTDPALTDNPTTALRARVRSFIDNDAKTRGWSDAEIGALKEAANRGALGAVVQMLGSRLGTTIAAAGTTTLGLKSGMGPWASAGTGVATKLIGEGAAAPLRSLGNYMQMQRLRNALDVLGERVPPNPRALPDMPPEPPPVAGPRPLPLGPRYPGL